MKLAAEEIGICLEALGSSMVEAQLRYEEKDERYRAEWQFHEFLLVECLRSEGFLFEHSRIVWAVMENHNVVDLTQWKRFSKYLSPIASTETSDLVFNHISLDGFLTKPSFMRYLKASKSSNDHHFHSKVVESVLKLSKKMQTRLKVLAAFQSNFSGNLIFMETFLVIQRPLLLGNVMIKYEDILFIDYKNNLRIRHKLIDGPNSKGEEETDTIWGFVPPQLQQISGRSDNAEVLIGIFRNVKKCIEFWKKSEYTEKVLKVVMRQVFCNLIITEALFKSKCIEEFQDSLLVVSKYSEEEMSQLFESKVVKDQSIFGEFDDKKDLRDGFDIKVLRDNVKRVGIHLRPLSLLFLVRKYLQRWENPFISIICFLLCMYLAANDLVQYLPVFFLCFHVTLLLLFFTAPSWTTNVIEDFLLHMELFKLKLEGPIEPKEEVQVDGGSEKRSFWKNNAIAEFWRKGMGALESLQNRCISFNRDVDRLKGLYLWTSLLHSGIYTMVLFVLMVLLVLVPFRILFAIASFGFFIGHLISKDSKGPSRSEKFFNTIPPVSKIVKVQ